MEPLENLTRVQRFVFENGTEEERERLRQQLGLQNVGDTQYEPLPEVEEEEAAPTPQTEQPQLTRVQRFVLQSGTEEEKARLIAQLGITPESAESVPEEAPEGFTGQFLTGRNYRVVRDYMEVNFGMTEDRYSREEIVQSYITNMRRFNAGQSVVTVSELSKLYKAGDNLSKYTDAYRIWDEANGVFSDEADATLGEQIRGIYDYARAAIVDPVNLFSFGAGKLAGMSASRVAVEGGRRIAAREVAQRGMQVAVTRAGEEAAERATGTALSRRLAVSEARDRARVQFQRNLLDETTPDGAQYQQVLRRAQRAEIAGGAAFESIASGSLDVGYQNAMIQANLQEEINPIQLAVSTFAPAAFAGAFMARSTGSTSADRFIRQTSVQTAIEHSNMNRIRAAVLAGNTARTRPTSEEAGERVSAAIQEAAEGFRTWREKVEAGGQLLDGGEGVTIDRIGEDEARAFFYVGSPELGINGIAQAVVDIMDGDTIEAISNASENFTDAMTNILEYLPRARQLEVVEFFNQTVGEITPSLKATDIKDINNYLSKISNQWGKTGANLSYAAGIIRNASPNTAILAKEGATDKNIGEVVISELLNGAADAAATKEVVDEVEEGLVSKFQNAYVRALVTHPGTTMLNLTGYAGVSAINSAATTLRGTLYGSVGLIHGLVTGKGTASEYVQKAAFEFGTLKRQLSNLVDPYATYDEAMSYLLARPEARKEMFKYIAGGVESNIDENLILKAAGLEDAAPNSVGYFEKYMQAMQVVYGVRAVDFFSKTQEFMTQLDRQIRRKYGVSYNEFLQRDDFAEIMTSKNSKTFKDFVEIETAAVNETLRTTLNKSHADAPGIGQLAGLIERVRTVPIIGALAPFGQFFNNTMALTADLVGVTPLYHLYLKSNTKLTGKSVPVDRDMTEMLSKMAIGYGLVGYFTAQEMQAIDEGIPVFTERDENGALVTRAYDFPLSAFKGYGRIIAHYMRDGEVPEDVWNEVQNMVGFASFSRQLTDTYGSVVDGILETIRDPESGISDVVMKIVGTSAAQYASGLSRSLDPLNQIAALSRGEDFQAIDRSVGNKNFNNAIRYIDQFAEPFLDDSRKAPVSPTTGREPTAQTNRIFGYRELPAPSTIERMFADIGRPNWKTELRVPDGNAGRILDQHIYPILEQQAARLLESPLWERSSLAERQRAVRSILTGARSEMLESLRRSYNEPDRKAAFIYDIFRTGLTARDRDELIAGYGVEPENMWTLTARELEQLLFVIRREARYQRRTGADIREFDFR